MLFRSYYYSNNFCFICIFWAILMRLFFFSYYDRLFRKRSPLWRVCWLPAINFTTSPSKVSQVFRILYRATKDKEAASFLMVGRLKWGNESWVNKNPFSYCN